MNKNDAIVSSLAVLLAAVVLLSPVACTAHRHKQITEAIKSGADPLAAKCAIEADNHVSALCLVYAAGQKPAHPQGEVVK